MITTTQAPPLEPGSETEHIRSARVPLIAYATDRVTLGVLNDVLSPALGPAAEFRLGGIAQACAGLQRLDEPVAAILVDVSGVSNPISELERVALYVEPGVQVFVIGEVESLEFYRQLVRGMGVQEYLFKPVNREIVARRILPALTGDVPAQSRGGRVVTVTGVRGGVGATTIAVNLAVQLADSSRHHIALLDADLHSGVAALMLSASADGGLRTALEDPERVDSIFAERSAHSIGDRLHLLAAEEPLQSVVNVADGAAAHLTSLLKNRSNFVIIDLPRHTTPLNLDFRALANVRILVMDATLPSIRDALRHIAVATGPNQSSRPILILNNLGAPGRLSRKQVTDGLGRDVDIVIPWLPKQLSAAQTLGQPAVGRRSAFQTAISDLSMEFLPVRTRPKKSWRDRFGLAGKR